MSLEASRRASSLLLVAWRSLWESSATANFQCSSREVGGGGGGSCEEEDMGLLRESLETRDLKIPLGLESKEECL